MKQNLEAQKILVEIEKHLDGNSHVLEFVSETPDATRQAIRKSVADYGQKVVVSIVPEYRHNLIVNIKAVTRMVALENLLRKVMNHIDDDAMYQEIYNALYPEHK